MNQEKFLTLFEELIPLKNKLASTVDYRSLRFTYQDIIGFFDEKLLYVFMKYPDRPYEEVKAITITSLHTLRSRIYRQYGKEVNMEEPTWVPQVDEEDYLAQLQDLIENLKHHLSKEQWLLAKVLFMPPMYVLSKVQNQNKRIPSHLYLDYLGLPSGKQEVKRFNKFRKQLILFIRSNFNPETLEYIPYYLK